MVVAGDGAKEYAAGFAAGVATVITGHPFDTVKVKLQAHNTKTEVKEYRNALHCTGRILKSEGVKGLYRGASSSFIGVAFESSLLFGIYAQTRKLLQGETESSRPQLQVIIPSAAFAGAIISFILCPAELVKVCVLVKPTNTVLICLSVVFLFSLYLGLVMLRCFQCRIQVQGRESATSSYIRYAGPLDCALKTMKSEGVRGILRGGFTTLLRESIGNATFFSTYEYSRHYMHLQLNSNPARSHQSKLFSDVGIGIISGGLAGMAFWTVVLPLDVAKTVIQTVPDPNSSRNPFRMLSSIYNRVGLRGCYAGLGPTLLRAFPANAVAIVTWELMAKLLGVKRD